MDDKLVRLSDVERWILTESPCIDTPADRDYVVDRMRHSIPAVDAVEVVRCGECIHRKKYQDDEQQGDTICTLEWKMKKLDWYCADGQRRKEET